MTAPQCIRNARLCQTQQCSTRQNFLGSTLISYAICRTLQNLAEPLHNYPLVVKPFAKFAPIEQREEIMVPRACASSIRHRLTGRVQCQAQVFPSVEVVLMAAQPATV